MAESKFCIASFAVNTTHYVHPRSKFHLNSSHSSFSRTGANLLPKKRSAIPRPKGFVATGIRALEALNGIGSFGRLFAEPLCPLSVFALTLTTRRHVAFVLFEIGPGHVSIKLLAMVGQLLPPSSNDSGETAGYR
jgi:hypothetical protein